MPEAGVEGDFLSDQKRVAAFKKKHGLRSSPEHAALDLASEVGELAKEILSSSDYGRKRFKKTRAAAGELGDVYYSLLFLANELGVDADAELCGALRKYEARLRKRGSPGSK